ncbi:MAG TPA: phosphate ABC transporter substrate-binding/OmpA family protein [Fimbriimonas sp.]|nr:phosphate ABC transporter substrate-binding/OmpA family protein [Fimbriimonas sp.]
MNAKAIMQVDWSRGGDAIVADQSIHRIEDLKGKKISLALFTPSHWLLEYSLQNSSLDESEQAKIAKSLVGKNASPDARTDFVAGKVDACVVWEPDVTEALKQRPGSHILVSSKTASNLIADLMVARQDFIQQHPDVIKAFVQGWMDGTAEANRHPETVTKLLMENEPVYKDLGESETTNGLSTVKWATLEDNTKMFGLDGSEPLFNRLFVQAGKTWVKRGYISSQVSPSEATDTSALKEMYTSMAPDVRPVPPKEEFPVKSPPPASVRSAPAIMDRPVNIYFGSGRAVLSENAKQVLDSVATMSKAFSNAYIRVEGNTDSVGNPATNQRLSQSRAQAVVNYLVARYGFDRNRFVALGNGPNNPVASNSTEAGRSKNRRTDIKIISR